MTAPILLGLAFFLIAAIAGVGAWVLWHVRAITVDWRLEWDQPGEVGNDR